jgi:hypothetical protein
VKERTKRLRECSCQPKTIPSTYNEYQVLCHWGHCTEWRCKVCTGLMISVGPAWCQCDGYVRWLRYPGMRNENVRYDHVADEVITIRVAVKPSKARRSQAGKHN